MAFGQASWLQYPFWVLSLPVTNCSTPGCIPGITMLLRLWRYLFLGTSTAAEHYHAGPEALCGESSIKLPSKLFVLPL